MKILRTLLLTLIGIAHVVPVLPADVVLQPAPTPPVIREMTLAGLQNNGDKYLADELNAFLTFLEDFKEWVNTLAWGLIQGTWDKNKKDLVNKATSIQKELSDLYAAAMGLTTLITKKGDLTRDYKDLGQSLVKQASNARDKLTAIRTSLAKSNTLLTSPATKEARKVLLNSLIPFTKPLGTQRLIPDLPVLVILDHAQILFGKPTGVAQAKGASLLQRLKPSAATREKVKKTTIVLLQGGFEIAKILVWFQQQLTALERYFNPRDLPTGRA